MSDHLESARKYALDNPILGFPYFTDSLCRDNDTGTWFSEAEDDYMHDSTTRYSGGQVTMYQYLYEKWLRDGRKEIMLADPPYWAKYYLKSAEYRMVGKERNLPVFFWNHGWIPLEWGARMHYAKQPNHVILGGYGSSKTSQVGMSGFVHCATVDRFKFVCVASVQSQAKPMYDEIIDTVVQTEAQNFIYRTRQGAFRYSESPNPNIRFANGSEMWFLGADKDLKKIRSVGADWVVVEQAETHSSLESIRRELGSRRRGRVRGRKRLGRMTYVANSGEAPALWEQFDNAEEDPTRYLSYSLSSYDNPHLSKEDIENYEKDVCGGDKLEIEQYMVGMKPTGKYHDFPKDVVQGCESDDLDMMMKSLQDAGEDGAIQREVRGMGHILWTLPAAERRDYAVYGDPGTRNPPGRGAGVVLAIDETSFPDEAADVVHFEWVVGNNKIGPWLDAFETAIDKFSANGRAYYDSTGDQKTLDELAFADRGLLVEGINMVGVKHGMKLKMLRIMERFLIRWARGISPIRQQFAKYDERVDRATAKLPQDIVMTFYLAAYKLAERMRKSGGTENVGAVRKMVRGPGGIRRRRTIRNRARR